MRDLRVEHSGFSPFNGALPTPVSRRARYYMRRIAVTYRRLLISLVWIMARARAPLRAFLIPPTNFDGTDRGRPGRPSRADNTRSNSPRCETTNGVIILRIFHRLSSRSRLLSRRRR